jgi:DNA mismatch repair protein MutL
MSFVVAEGPDGLYLIDQHAAHERVLFEQLLDAQKSTPESQALLTPIHVTLTSAQAELLDSQIPHLEHLGFDVEPFGPNSYSLRAIPALLTGIDPEAALRVLVEDFEEDEAPLEQEIEALIAARVCKRAAIKSGQVLGESEMKALLEGLEKCRAPRTCPHGRPTMIHLSVDLLERQFGRRGAR